MRSYELIDDKSCLSKIIIANNLKDARAEARSILGVRRLPTTVTVIAKVSQKDINSFFELCYKSFDLVKNSFFSSLADRQALITIKIRNAVGLTIFGNQKELKRQIDKARTMYDNGYCEVM